MENAWFVASLAELAHFLEQVGEDGEVVVTPDSDVVAAIIGALKGAGVLNVVAGHVASATVLLPTLLQN